MKMTRTEARWTVKPDTLRVSRSHREQIDAIVQDAWNDLFCALDNLPIVDTDEAGKIATEVSAQLRRLLESTVAA